MKAVLSLHGSRGGVLAMFAMALTVSLAPAGVAWAEGKPKNLYMVSVGITNAIGQPVLQSTKKDALDVAKWAHSQKGKLFGQVHVATITNERATGKRVLGALSGLESKAKAGDYVIFYISSHGAKNKKGEYFFCAYDGNVLWSQITNALRKAPGNKIVILDTCFAGAATSSNMVVMAACRANQFSHDGTSARGNSIYTQYLLEGLYGKADANKNGIVTLAEAAAYASAKLHKIYDSKPAKDQQFSVLHRPNSISASLPLAKLRAAAGLTIFWTPWGSLALQPESLRLDLTGGTRASF